MVSGDMLRAANIVSVCGGIVGSALCVGVRFDTVKTEASAPAMPSLGRTES